MPLGGIAGSMYTQIHIPPSFAATRRTMLNRRSPRTQSRCREQTLRSLRPPAEYLIGHRVAEITWRVRAKPGVFEKTTRICQLARRRRPSAGGDCARNSFLGPRSAVRSVRVNQPFDASSIESNGFSPQMTQMALLPLAGLPNIGEIPRSAANSPSGQKSWLISARRASIYAYTPSGDYVVWQPESRQLSAASQSGRTFTCGVSKKGTEFDPRH